jgi:RHS repeat-associated protein
LMVRYLVGLDPTGRYSVMAQETVPSPNQGGPVIWAADNNLGTPLDIVDNTGTLANHRVFSAFGEDVYDSDASLSYWVGFAGGHADPTTGLVNDYERWYNPATGTWQSPDPEDFAAGDANLERYAGNAPTVHVDRLGLQADGPAAQPPQGKQPPSVPAYRYNTPPYDQMMQRRLWQLSVQRGMTQHWVDQQVAYAHSGAANLGYWDFYAAARQHGVDAMYQQQHNQYEIGAAIRRAQRDAEVTKEQAREMRTWTWMNGGSLPGGWGTWYVTPWSWQPYGPGGPGVHGLGGGAVY